MSARNDQCKKVCRILDDVLANRPSERDTLIIATQTAFKALVDDGWIPYTGQHIENGRYLVQIETGVIVCGTYSEHGFVFPFCSDVIEAFRPLPKPYEPKEDK